MKRLICIFTPPPAEWLREKGLQFLFALAFLGAHLQTVEAQVVTITAPNPTDPVSLASLIGAQLPANAATGLTIDVCCQLVVDQSYTFNNCILRFCPSAQLLIDGPSSPLLTLTNSQLIAQPNQTVMWKGVRMAQETRIKALNTLFQDSEYGIDIQGFFNILDLDGNTFNRNYIGINLAAPAGFTVSNVSWAAFRNNTFNCDMPLLADWGSPNNIWTRTYCGIYLENAQTQVIQGGANFNNFRNICVGVFLQGGGTLSFSGFAMEDLITDTNYGTLNTGIGVRTQGTATVNAALNVVGTATEINTIRNARVGFRASATPEFVVSYGTLENVDNGVEYVSNTNASVYITHNSFDCNVFGVNMNLALLASGNIYINQDNNFTMDGAGNGMGTIGVRVSGGNPTSAFIEQNTFNLGFAERGISLIDAKGWKVKNNRIFLNQAINRSGIHLIGGNCFDNEVSCNLVQSTVSAATQGTNARVGIRLGGLPSSNQNTVSCNTIIDTRTGIRAENQTKPTVLRGNSFEGTMLFGLDVNNSNVGEQDNHNNQWVGTFTNWGAINNQVPIFPDVFKCDPFTVPELPPTYSPGNWFNITSSPGFFCGSLGSSCLYAPVPQTTLNGGDYGVASGTFFAPEFEAGQAAHIERDLFAKLDAEPALRSQWSGFQNFYLNNSYTDLGLLHTVRRGLEAPQPAAQALSASWEALRAQHAALRANFSAVQNQLGQAATAQTLDSLMSEGAAISNAMQALKAQMDVEMEAQQALQSANAAALVPDNDQVQGNDLFAANDKWVNALLLDYLANGTVLDNVLAQQVYALAEQCPLVAGPAVYTAQVLYATYDLGKVFNDEAPCTQAGFRQARPDKATAPRFTLAPNPVSDMAMLGWNQALTGSLALSVTDATGRVVFQTMLNGEQRQYPLYVTGWAPGAYALVLRGTDGTPLHQDKFVVTP